MGSGACVGCSAGAWVGAGACVGSAGAGEHATAIASRSTKTPASASILKNDFRGVDDTILLRVEKDGVRYEVWKRCNWISGGHKPSGFVELTKIDEDGRRWTIFFVNVRLIVYVRLVITPDEDLKKLFGSDAIGFFVCYRRSSWQ